MRKTLALLFILFLITACEIDHGLGTLDSRITGRVIFLNQDKKPDYVESVRIVAAVNLPPQSLGDVVFTNTSVNLSKDEPDYYVPAPLATYQLVAAVWKEKGQAWNYSKILGFYGFDPVNFTFDSVKVVLTKEQPVAKNIDIYCDWSILPEKQNN
ncbi:hypothetical protein JXQ31_19095 [candidate division KSB1 bacterium]|nr:hypothetical protein [candidate division KSB1 bacterium]